MATVTTQELVCDLDGRKVGVATYTIHSPGVGTVYVDLCDKCYGSRLSTLVERGRTRKPAPQRGKVVKRRVVDAP